MLHLLQIYENWHFHPPLYVRFAFIRQSGKIVDFSFCFNKLYLLPMRMVSKDKELVPGSEEPSIRITTPLSRLQVSLIQELLRDTGWKHSDKFHSNATTTTVRPTYKVTLFQA